jgi:hypothetical protein
MSRKRKSDQESSSETPTAVADRPAADLPVAERAPDETPAAKADRQSFVERVTQKKWPTAPDPFGIAQDNVAGVRLFESKRDRQMAIKFGDGGPEHKPSQAVIDRIKEAGYRWSPADRVWTYPVRADAAMSIRIEAEQLYQEVRQMIREEKGIEPSQDVPF